MGNMENVAPANIKAIEVLLRSGFQPAQMPKHKNAFQLFRFNVPELSGGKKKSITRLCTTDMMYSAVHVLVDGGDAPLHRHAAMDQFWMVLKGMAVFTDEKGRQHRLDTFCGICVPRGAAYSYRKDGPDPLVLLQVLALNAKAKKNTLKFIGETSNDKVQDASRAKTELYDGVVADINV